MKIFIVDDNNEFCTTIADSVRAEGWQYDICNNPAEALDYLAARSSEIALMLLDVEFHHPQFTGMDVLERSVRLYPNIPVVMITGVGTIEAAVKATRLGAANFIEKSSIGHGRLKEVIYTALERVNKRNDDEKVLQILRKHGIFGESAAIKRVGEQILRYGKTELSVLITGETGTGKKLVAQALHGVSKREKFNFVTVDIPNIPATLFQSELFGHTKGAFSGASEDKLGLFQQADKGTIFLDEIGDLSPELQANLLVPVEEKMVRRLGSVKTDKINVRFVSATDRNLLEAIRDGGFREQLYHRLRECEIQIPPLRERREDIPFIVENYVQLHNSENEEQKYFDPSALDFLMELSWNGNVRELVNLLKVVVQTSFSDRITIQHITDVMPRTADKLTQQQPVLADLVVSGNTLKDDISALDRMKVEAALERCNGNVSKASAQLGISRETLHQRIKKYGINTNAYRSKKS